MKRLILAWRGFQSLNQSLTGRLLARTSLDRECSKKRNKVFLIFYYYANVFVLRRSWELTTRIIYLEIATELKSELMLAKWLIFQILIIKFKQKKGWAITIQTGKADWTPVPSWLWMSGYNFAFIRVNVKKFYVLG